MNRNLASLHPHRCSWLRSPYPAIALLAWLGLVGMGCNSTGYKDPAQFASVTISDAVPQAIADAICKVFGADGWFGGVTGRGELTFDQPASKGTTIVHEGLIGASTGAQTVKRVRVEVVAEKEGKHRVQCQAYIVRGGSDPFFSEELAMKKGRAGPYRDLLKRVAQELEPSPPPTKPRPGRS